MTGSERIAEHGFTDYDDMFAAVKPCYDKAYKEIQADGMLPSGTALQYALQHGVEKVHGDNIHANLGVGCFILALVWYASLNGNDAYLLLGKYVENPIFVPELSEGSLVLPIDPPSVEMNCLMKLTIIQKNI